MKFCRTAAAIRQTSFSSPVVAMSSVSGVISILDCAENGSRIKREHSRLMPSPLINPTSTGERRRLLRSPYLRSRSKGLDLAWRSNREQPRYLRHCSQLVGVQAREDAGMEPVDEDVIRNMASMDCRPTLGSSWCRSCKRL